MMDFLYSADHHLANARSHPTLKTGVVEQHQHKE